MFDETRGSMFKDFWSSFFRAWNLFPFDGVYVFLGGVWKEIPSRELTYPTWGKGKSYSKCHFWGIC